MMQKVLYTCTCIYHNVKEQNIIVVHSEYIYYKYCAQQWNLEGVALKREAVKLYIYDEIIANSSTVNNTSMEGALVISFPENSVASAKLTTSIRIIL